MQNALRKYNTGIPIALLTIIVFLVPFLVQITHISLIKLIEDGAYFLMLLSSIFIIKRNNEKIRINPTIMILVFALLTFALIGIYYSGIGIVILQIREFKYLLLLVILIPYNKIEDYKYVWPTLKIIAAICIPVAIIQWMVFKAIGDFVTGIMGYKASGTLTIFLLLIFFTEFTYRLIKNRKIFGLYFFYLVPIALNETKITIFLVPIMIFASLIFSRKFKFKYVIVILIFLLVFFVGYFNLYKTTGYQDSFSANFSYQGLKEYMLASNWGDEDAGRLTKVFMALDFIKHNEFLGFGLGASYGGETSGLVGYIYAGNNVGSKLNGTRPQLVLSLIDLGILGTIIVIIFLIAYFVKIISIKKFSFEKIVAFNSSLLILLAFPYQQIFYNYQIMFIFTMFTFVSLRLSNENRKYEVETTLSTLEAR